MRDEEDRSLPMSLLLSHHSMRNQSSRVQHHCPDEIQAVVQVRSQVRLCPSTRIDWCCCHSALEGRVRSPLAASRRSKQIAVEQAARAEAVEAAPEVESAAVVSIDSAAVHPNLAAAAAPMIHCRSSLVRRVRPQLRQAETRFESVSHLVNRCWNDATPHDSVY